MYITSHQQSFLISLSPNSICHVSCLSQDITMPTNFYPGVSNLICHGFKRISVLNQNYPQAVVILAVGCSSKFLGVAQLTALSMKVVQQFALSS